MSDTGFGFFMGVVTAVILSGASYFLGGDAQSVKEGGYLNLVMERKAELVFKDNCSYVKALATIPEKNIKEEEILKNVCIAESK